MKSTKNPDLESYFEKDDSFKSVVNELRRILLSFDLKEEKKWYQPCYTYKGKNLIIIGKFKNHCVLNFFKGALLKGYDDLLEKPGENSRSARMVRLLSLEEVKQKEPQIKEAILAMLKAEDQGLKIELKAPTPQSYPQELEEAFQDDPKFKTTFESLTPGRQRAWLLHFNGAKQSKTRHERIEKAYPQIFEGLGHNENYQKKKQDRS